MKQIDSVFKRKNIAVISSHRINYIGGLVENNRTCTLELLNLFLRELLKKYPDVEFHSSDNLIDIMS